MWTTTFYLSKSFAPAEPEAWGKGDKANKTLLEEIELSVILTQKNQAFLLN